MRYSNNWNKWGAEKQKLSSQVVGKKQYLWKFYQGKEAYRSSHPLHEVAPPWFRFPWKHSHFIPQPGSERETQRPRRRSHKTSWQITCLFSFLKISIVPPDQSLPCLCTKANKKPTRHPLVWPSPQTHLFPGGEFWAAIRSETHLDWVSFLLRSSLLLRLFSFEQYTKLWGCCGPRHSGFEVWWNKVVAKRKKTWH